MTTPEEFYYGNIIPNEIPIIKGSEYDTANRLVVRHDEALTATQAEQKKNAEKCGDLWVNSDRLFINRRGEPMRPYYPYKGLKDFCERGFLRTRGSALQGTAQLPPHRRDAVDRQRRRRVHRVRASRTQQCLDHAEHLHPCREKSKGKGGESDGGAD